MLFTIVILGYLGPETMLPVTSVIAGAIGVVMMFGRNAIRWVVGSFKAVTSHSKAKSAAPGPARRIGSRPVGGVARGQQSKSRASE